LGPSGWPLSFARLYERGSRTETQPGDIVTADVKRSLVEVEEADLASLPALSPVVAPTHRMFGVLCLLVTAFGWAMNWVVLKLLMQEWPPLFTRGVAGTVAALGLALVAVLSRQSIVVPRAAAPARRLVHERVRLDGLCVACHEMVERR
jgi:EamA-like transporter family